MGRRLSGPVAGIDASVAIPSSKSLTNRALIVAAAANGGTISRPLDCEDTRLLATALERCGWPVSWTDEIVIGPRRPVDAARLDLGNSGTGSRLIIGLLGCTGGHFRVDGTSRLRERPMAPLIDALTGLGVRISSRDGFLPVEIDGGPVKGGRVSIRPEVSSQFVSSLMLAAPLMTNGLEIEVVGGVPSGPYLDLTHQVLQFFGARVVKQSRQSWSIAAGGLRPTAYAVEGDWSAVAFAAAAAAVAGGAVAVGPLSRHSAQGDKAICSILERAGLHVSFSGDRLHVEGPSNRAFDADLTATPDLFPALAVVAAAGPVGSVLRGLDHLKHKESDRLSVMIENLTTLGAVFDKGPSSIRVRRPLDRRHRGGVEVTAANDHRIAMAMAVAALAVGPLDLDDDTCVGKSFPDFWQMWDCVIKSAGPPP